MSERKWVSGVGSPSGDERRGMYRLRSEVVGPSRRARDACKSIKP